MPHAVELYFDLPTDARIRQVWQALSGAGVCSAMLHAGYRPHVSLAVCEQLNVDSLTDDLTTLAKRLTPFPFMLSSVGFFPGAMGVVFFGVVVTDKLLKLHAEFHRILQKHAAGLSPYYFPDIWVPHCTLGFGIAANMTDSALEICRQQQLPIKGRFEEIGCAEVSPLAAKATCSFVIGKQ
jgi:2'-5' RNA ligase